MHPRLPERARPPIRKQRLREDGDRHWQGRQVPGASREEGGGRCTQMGAGQTTLRGVIRSAAAR
ncbi:MAG TPA: hypothetical protein VGF67_12085 [Ktedonobacteraceae bacterium]